MGMFVATNTKNIVLHENNDKINAWGSRCPDFFIWIILTE